MVCTYSEHFFETDIYSSFHIDQCTVFAAVPEKKTRNNAIIRADSVHELTLKHVPQTHGQGLSTPSLVVNADTDRMS
jgi:hypothetical protein